MELRRGNPKAFETVALKLKELRGLEGRVGWFEDAKYESGMPVAAVAAIQELGAAGKSIPPRPTVRPTAIVQREAWADLAAQGARSTIAGNAAPEQVMEKLTLRAENDIRDAINALTEPPLSPVTIELRAMKKRDPNLRVTGATVGIAAAKVNKPGYQKPNVSDKPLIETGLMVGKLTSKVERT